MFQPSQRQQDIFNLWDNEDTNLVISAVAGSGKTTTLLQILERCEYRTLFIAFNTSVQEEIQNRIEEKNLKQGKARTIHSIGLEAIRNKYKCKIEKGKNYKLIREFQNLNKKYFKLPWKEKLKLTYTLMDMNDASRLFLTDSYEGILDNCIKTGKNIFLADNLRNIWEDFRVLRDQSYEGRFIEIDFTDMIYLPVIKDLEIPIYPTYLMVDEAQDLNLCQHALVDKMVSQPTLHKWIAVGDPNQSIYGFSGAYSDSFSMFEDKGNVTKCPLDICYRCDIKILEKANEVYDVMQPFSQEEGIVDTIEDSDLIKPNSMVICRNTNPLIELYFELLSQRKAAYIKGDDIMNSILKFLKPYGDYMIFSAVKDMQKKAVELSKDSSDKGKIAFHIHTQNLLNFQNLIKGFNLSERVLIKNIIDDVKEIFKDRENAITLCTIHKSKGLENDVVYILNEHLIPSKFATSPEQLKQEQNLKYVARTRAKHELYFLNI